MNILVKTTSGKVIVRPDTTWEKDNEDFYPQDFIEELSWSPILFARISKPGKSVGLKFASRYYDALNYGVLLYPENLIRGEAEDYASASCVDHTSFLPAPLYQKCVFASEDNRFILNCEDRQLCDIGCEGVASIEQAIVEASAKIYMRVGDMIAVELRPREHLWSRADGIVRIHGTFCDNEVIDFNIK